MKSLGQLAVLIGAAGFTFAYARDNPSVETAVPAGMALFALLVYGGYQWWRMDQEEGAARSAKQAEDEVALRHSMSLERVN